MSERPEMTPSKREIKEGQNLQLMEFNNASSTKERKTRI
jgi:hypothetical protein